VVVPAFNPTSNERIFLSPHPCQHLLSPEFLSEGNASQKNTHGMYPLISKGLGIPTIKLVVKKTKYGKIPFSFQRETKLKS